MSINYPKTRDGRTTEHKATYNSWRAMKERCNNPKYRCYARYGGRGIAICERWQGADGFANFLQDMGERPNDMTLDRINLDGNYEPNNCRWADQKTQLRNSSKVLNAILTESELENAACSRSVVYKRIKAGWEKEMALSTPSKTTYEIVHERAMARRNECLVCGKKVPQIGRPYCGRSCYWIDRKRKIALAKGDDEHGKTGKKTAQATAPETL